MATKNKRGGLGRGLGALIPGAPPSGATAAVPGPGTPPPLSSSPIRPDGPRDDERDVIPTDSSDEVPAGSVAPAETDQPADHTDDAGTAASAPAPAADDGPLPVPGASFAELPIGSVHPNAKQPRQVFDEDAMAELTHSVREFGVLQPIVVRADGDGYELVMGERRLRAATAAGLDTVPAIVRTTSDDAMLRDALLENIHRAQLNPLEEAAAYQQLLEEFGATHDELAQRIGRSRPQVSNTIRLLNLSIPVQRRVAAGVLSAGHARALLGLADTDQQDELAGRIVAEGLSVRATEELVTLAQRGHADKPKVRTSPVRRISAPAVVELAGKLSDVFDTRVRVDLGRRKGKITVEFASVDDLERIVGVMAPQLIRQRPPAQAEGTGSGEGPVPDDVGD